MDQDKEERDEEMGVVEEDPLAARDSERAAAQDAAQESEAEQEVEEAEQEAERVEAPEEAAEVALQEAQEDEQEAAEVAQQEAQEDEQEADQEDEQEADQEAEQEADQEAEQEDQEVEEEAEREDQEAKQEAEQKAEQEVQEVEQEGQQEAEQEVQEVEQEGQQDAQEVEQSERHELGAEAASDPERVASGAPQQPEASRSSLANTDFHRDIDRWKDLYQACQAKLEGLRELYASLQEQIEAPGGTDASAAEARRCWDELRAEVQAATSTLEQEHALVERALEKHGAVLGQLLGRLHARGEVSASRLQPAQSLQPPPQQRSSVPRDATAGKDDSPPPASSHQGGAEPAAITRETIVMLKDLIQEHEQLSGRVEEERVKHRQMDPYSKERHSAAAMRATEDKLQRTSGLLQLQVRRLQYELSRLAQAHATETDAVTKLHEQADAELRLTLAHEEALRQARQQLQEGTRMSGAFAAQELYRHGSRSSFVDSLERLQRRKERRRRLEGRLHSDRVYREVDELDDQAEELRRVAGRLSAEIEDMNEAGRALESTWLSLRQERDELTAHLYPDLQRLQELQEIAKDRLELEAKLHKEHFLFRRQMEDFQKEILEVETDLVTGNISRKARATKNIVAQLLVLRDCITDQNAELWRELQDKHLSVSSADSVASAAMGEEELRQHITDKMKKMELSIKQNLDERTLLKPKPKKFVFESPGPGASKVPFRGQRNVIKVPSKMAQDWRKKTTIEMHRQEEMDRQVENLRREILNKLAQEKEKAKQNLLQYEAKRVAGGSPATASSENMKASQELRSILGQLDSFLRRSRKVKDREASSYILEEVAAEGEDDDFGREMRMLVIQLEKLQTALEGGSKDRERERKATALQRGRELFDQLPGEDGGPDGPDGPAAEDPAPGPAR